LALGVLLCLTISSSADQVTVNGVKRLFTVTCPRGGCVANLPVILGFHGAYQSPGNFADNARFEAHGAQAIMVYPLGTPMVAPTWNAGTEPPSVWAEENDSDDLGFVKAILDDLDSKYHIDRARVFATGISNGGRFAWRIACETDWLAGIATIAGTESDANCGPVSHPPLLIVSGTDDQIEPFDGGGFGGSGIPFSIGIDLWRDAHGSVTVLRPGGGHHTWNQPGIDTTATVLDFFGVATLARR
jgi:polyhydroxybutyrate depolymerase